MLPFKITLTKDMQDKYHSMEVEEKFNFFTLTCFCIFVFGFLHVLAYPFNLQVCKLIMKGMKQWATTVVPNMPFFSLLGTCEVASSQVLERSHNTLKYYLSAAARDYTLFYVTKEIVSKLGYIFSV